MSDATTAAHAGGAATVNCTKPERWPSRGALLLLRWGLKHRARALVRLTEELSEPLEAVLTWVCWMATPSPARAERLETLTGIPSRAWEEPALPRRKRP